MHFQPAPQGGKYCCVRSFDIKGGPRKGQKTEKGDHKFAWWFKVHMAFLENQVCTGLCCEPRQYVSSEYRVWTNMDAATRPRLGVLQFRSLISKGPDDPGWGDPDYKASMRMPVPAKKDPEGHLFNIDGLDYCDVDEKGKAQCEPVGGLFDLPKKMEDDHWAVFTDGSYGVPATRAYVEDVVWDTKHPAATGDFIGLNQVHLIHMPGVSTRWRRAVEDGYVRGKRVFRYPYPGGGVATGEAFLAAGEAGWLDTPEDWFFGDAARNARISVEHRFMIVVRTANRPECAEGTPHIGVSQGQHYMESVPASMPKLFPFRVFADGYVDAMNKLTVFSLGTSKPYRYRF